MAIKSNGGRGMLPDHHGISSGMPDPGPAERGEQTQPLPTPHDALEMDQAALAEQQAAFAAAHGFEVITKKTGPRVRSEFGTNDPKQIKNL